MGDKYIKGLEAVINQFALYFADRYFGSNATLDWVANDIGGVCNIADYYFTFQNMMDYVKCKYTRTQMFDHYDYLMTEPTTCICIRDWKKMQK